VHEEERLTFRVVHNTASGFDGLPDGVQEFHLPVTADGSTQRVHAWWWPAAKRNAPTVLYLHGARWDLTGQLYRIEQLRDFGFSVFAIDYRGFGKSDGDVPSEKTVYEDAGVAWDWLARHQPDPALRYIYGHSLGGAVAVDLAARLSADSGKAGAANSAPAAGLILESTFTSLADIAREFVFPWVPVEWLLTQKFDSVRKIANVHMPVLIVHGVGDRYVPSRFSQALYDAAPQRKQLLLVDGATHDTSMRVGKAVYEQALSDLFGLGDKQTTLRVSARKPGSGSSLPLLARKAPALRRVSQAEARPASGDDLYALRVDPQLREGEELVRAAHALQREETLGDEFAGIDFGEFR
jgi:alpha-beta hydrolase superfamily lysophospholipase